MQTAAMKFMLTTDMLSLKNQSNPGKNNKHQTHMTTMNQTLRSLSLLALLGLLPMAAQAQYSWGSGGNGGAGTWNADNVNWFDGVSDVVWNSGSATFAGTAGIVTVSDTQSTTGITFGTSFYTLNDGTISLTGATPTISGGVGITINSVLESSTGAIFRNGKRLGGNNTNLNGIINADGNGTSASVLRVSNSNALGSSAAFADRLILTQGAQGAILQIDNGVVLNKYITNVGAATIETISGSASLTGNLVAGSTLVFSVANNSDLTLSGSAGLGQSGQSVQSTGAGRLIVDAVAGGNAYGLFIRNSSSVQVNNGATLGTANVFFDGVAGTPTLAINGGSVANNIFFGAAASPQIENMAAGSSTFSGQLLSNGGDFNVTLRSTTTGTLNVTGNINDGASTASVTIGKETAINEGVVNLSRASGNTYDGGTTVHSGTLLVNNTTGSGTGTGAVNVASGATLGGDGTISGATTIDGILAPGNSIGTLNIANDVTWNGAALASADTDWKFELGAVNTSDLLNISDSDFLKGTGSVFRFDFQGSTDLGTFVLVDWAGTTTFSETDFSFTNLGPGNTGTFAFNGSQLEFTAVPVPEPSSLALMLVAGIGGVVMSRKRRKESPTA